MFSLSQLEWGEEAEGMHYAQTNDKYCFYRALAVVIDYAEQYRRNNLFVIGLQEGKIYTYIFTTSLLLLLSFLIVVVIIIIIIISSSSSSSII